MQNQKLNTTMNEQQLKIFINSIDTKHFVHGSNYKAKLQDSKLDPNQKAKLLDFGEKYKTYFEKNRELDGANGSSEKVIKQRIELLNQYYNYLDCNGVNDVFSSQGKFRSTILEEFMYILLERLIENYRRKFEDKSLLQIGSARAYTNLYFSGASFFDFINAPQIGINQKDQDFAIYRPMTISIGKSNSIETNLPVVAIENKTYIDKTMLDGAIATAEKIKSGNPYALFLIVAENYDVDLNIDPIYSRIDQIYVLRKSRRVKNQPLQPIDYKVVVALVERIHKHLERDWSNVGKKMKETGQIL